MTSSAKERSRSRISSVTSGLSQMVPTGAPLAGELDAAKATPSAEVEGGMRILTVRQPWAWAILHGGKDVENRPRNIAGGYRGPVSIHAGQAYDDEAPLWMPGSVCPAPDSVSLSYGAIIGVVDLVDVHDLSEEAHGADSESMPQNCSAWAQWDRGTRYHLMLAHPRPLAEPIPFKGALGLRRLDDATTAAVLGAIA